MEKPKVLKDFEGNETEHILMVLEDISKNDINKVTREIALGHVNEIKEYKRRLTLNKLLKDEDKK